MMKNCDIEQLERQGCFSKDWDLVSVSDGTDLSKIHNVYFAGPVAIGANSEIINVPGGLSNVRIGDNVRIVNVSRIQNSPNATFGIGTDVAVLDETGKRPVRIYPGISAQVATIAAFMPEYAKEKLIPLINRHISEFPDMSEIGDNAEILDSGPIIDVRIWPGVKVEGAARLCNGSIVNNSSTGESLTFVGQGVDAQNFIIEDACVAGGCLIRNTYVGQGTILDKGFTSHDSLFFANCSMENGEACAVLAGPYTVSMHKSSLLIGCHTSFMNAGSATNMSNHMYKLGPAHWGILERGAKTSSNSYLMHGSRVGAYSLVMGEHKTHPDASCFPFSYLFGDSKGNTIVVPGAMLKSYGLKRDEEKWPTRDRRKDRSIRLHDRINFQTLNPHTVDMLIKAIDTIDVLINLPAEADGFISYKGMKIKQDSLSKGRHLYDLAVHKYLNSFKDKCEHSNASYGMNETGRWVDLSGQVVPESSLYEILNAQNIEEMEAALDKAAEDFDLNEQKWIANRLNDKIDLNADHSKKASELDALIEKDRLDSLDQIARENEMLSLL